MSRHHHHQRGVAEVGDVKCAVAQRLGSAVMLLQEVRSWLGGPDVLLGYELFTDVELDTAVAVPREFACDAREKVLLNKYTFVVLFGTIWGSVHLCCHNSDATQDDLWTMLKEKEDVIINIRRTSRIVIGSDLNVSLAPCREGVTGTRIHPNANRAPARRSSDRVDALRALCTFEQSDDTTAARVEWDRDNS